MKQLSEFPRVHLGILPTPLQKLENLSRMFGKEIYLKRDDMTGVSLGGNKVRKLEFLLADALERGADTVMTTGGSYTTNGWRQVQGYYDMRDLMGLPYNTW